MDYRQGLRYLEHVQGLGIKFGLDNVRTVLSSFGNPHQSYPTVLVAGSNGKGSVCAMLTRILSLHGFRVGLYTSPHLVRYEERIRVGSALIPQKAFSRILTRLRSRIERLIQDGKLAAPPTHFELLTCLALLHFAERRVDAAVLEVGMGGRFDATNVVTPLLTIITTISAEHQNALGESLEEIAFEKAGIIKPGVPLVCGVEDEPALMTIQARARALNAPLIRVFGPGSRLREEEGGRTYRFSFEGRTATLTPSLSGFHQGKNAAVALVAARELGSRFQPLSPDLILEGIASTTWEGRLETFLDRPLVLLDGAHNREAAEALRTFIQDRIHVPLTLVFAAMRDKKIEDMTSILFPLAEHVILTSFPYERAAAPEEIARRARGVRGDLRIEADVSDAVHRAVSLAGRRGAVVITGSIFLVGEVKKLFPDPRAVRR